MAEPPKLFNDPKAVLAQRQPQPVSQATITMLARERLAILNGETGLTYAQECAQAWIDKACEGDVHALRELLDRTEGKVPQAVTGADGGDLVVTHLIRPAVSREEWLKERGIAVLDTAAGATARRS